MPAAITRLRVDSILNDGIRRRGDGPEGAGNVDVLVDVAQGDLARAAQEQPAARPVEADAELAAVELVACPELVQNQEVIRWLGRNGRAGGAQQQVLSQVQVAIAG